MDINKETPGRTSQSNVGILQDEADSIKCNTLIELNKEAKNVEEETFGNLHREVKNLKDQTIKDLEGQVESFKGTVAKEIDTKLGDIENKLKDDSPEICESSDNDSDKSRKSLDNSVRKRYKKEWSVEEMKES